MVESAISRSWPYLGDMSLQKQRIGLIQNYRIHNAFLMLHIDTVLGKFSSL